MFFMYSFYLLIATFLDLSSKKKEGKKEQADPSANKSWLGRLNPFNLIPKGPPVAHLPDDKNPRVRERGGGGEGKRRGSDND